VLGGENKNDVDGSVAGYLVEEGAIEKARWYLRREEMNQPHYRQYIKGEAGN